MFDSSMARDSTMEKWVHLKILLRFPHVFHNPLVPIPNSTFVAVLLNLLRKRRAMMQKANVSHGKTKMDKTERRRVTLRSSFRVAV
jgi:hypothetical protein